MPTDGSVPVMVGLGFYAELSRAVSGNANDLLPTASNFLFILNTHYRVTDHILSLIRHSQTEGKEALVNYLCPDEQLQDKPLPALMDKSRMLWEHDSTGKVAV